jgi:hypothetical protein
VKRSRSIGRLSWAIAVALVGVALVGAAVVVAHDDDPSPESGLPDEIRYANPARTDPPRVVARGVTDSGQPYILRTSEAGRQLCVEVEYGSPRAVPDPTPSDEHEGPIATLLTSEVCVDPARHPISASLEHLFIDPETGQISDRPQRFVYGVVTVEATDVRLRSPSSAGRELQLAPVPNMPFKVFAGSAPGDADVGVGAVIAKTASGGDLAEYPLRFVGPGR